MSIKRATVFGGTGFLGRRVVDRFLAAGIGVRVAARQATSADPPKRDAASFEAFDADIRDENAVAGAVAGADVVVNAVSLYVERGDLTFAAVHVEGAARLAEQARLAGAGRLIHLSGIGADLGSRSTYVRSRAAGEAAVRKRFPAATILRPSVMFGADDSFLNTLIRMVRTLPVLPLFADGSVRLQPVHVDDVASAIVAAASRSDPPDALYELGGPEVLTYRQLLERVARRAGRRPLLVPVPYAVWFLLARAAAVLPNAPLTEDQVALMMDDNVADPGKPGLSSLIDAATPVDRVIDQLLPSRGQT
jgi:NADH dehydrogenase